MLNLPEILHVYLSVAVTYQRQILHIWSVSAAVSRGTAEFGKLAHRIWKNLLRKTVVPSDRPGSGQLVA